MFANQKFGKWGIVGEERVGNKLLEKRIIGHQE